MVAIAMGGFLFVRSWCSGKRAALAAGKSERVMFATLIVNEQVNRRVSGSQVFERRAQRNGSN